MSGALRMHLQLDSPAPLTFDLLTTHIHTWVGVPEARTVYLKT